MNRRLVVVLTATMILVSASCAFTQGITAKGIKAGLSLASVDVEGGYAEDWDTKVGFAAGGFVSIGLAPNVALQPEILYVERGGKQELLGTDEMGNPIDVDDAKLKLNYIEIPVLARVSVPTGGALTPSFLFGPALAIKLSSKAEYPGGMLLQDDATEIDLDWVKSTDFIVTFGAGFDLGLPAATITLDVRYNMGLSNINESETSDQVKFKNRSISILAGVGF